MADATKPRPIVSPAYREPVKLALVLQAIVGLGCSIMLDGGHTARLTAAVAIAFWTGVGIVMARRPMDPRPSDLQFVRWAFAPLWGIGAVIAQWWGF